MNDVEATVVTFPMSDNTDTTHVTAASDHRNDTRIELDKIRYLARGEVDLDGVVDLDQRIWVTNPMLTEYPSLRQPSVTKTWSNV